MVDKLLAYSLQDHGVDLVDANLMLGLPAGGRDHGAAGILHDLGIRAVRRLTNNPAKVGAILDGDVAVREQVPPLTTVSATNALYLSTKMHRFGQILGPMVTTAAMRMFTG